MKLTSWALSFLFSFLQLVAFSQQDRFAKIGGQEYKLRKDELIEPLPPVLPNKLLRSGNPPKAPLSFVMAHESKEMLYAELDSMRKVYAPFMENHAVLKESLRKRLPISTMQWRKETPEDKKNISHPAAGAGVWETVKIPHYGPPLGHAVTYYQQEIVLDDEMLRRGSLFVCFKGVDYKTEVYFNGTYCGSHEGFFAPFEFDISALAQKGKNKLMVKVMNEPTTTGSVDEHGNHVVGDKIYAAGGPGYDEPMEGWHICPPAMGIYQDCFIEARSDLFINDIFVRPLPQASKAEVWVEVFNSTKLPKAISLDLSLFGKNFKDTVFLNTAYNPTTTHVPGIGDMVKPTDWQSKSIPMQYGKNYIRLEVDVKDFRWWKPDQPWLYSMQVSLNDQQHQLLDAKASSFGMRSFSMDTINVPKGRMFLNGKQIRLRGANSMGFEQNDVMRKNWNQLRDDILLAKLCNMNFIRFTQRPVQDEVYDYCDMLGMLNQTDLPFFGAIRVNQFSQAVKQAEEMERLVRSHPSTVVVTYINERFPNAEGSPQRSFASASEIFMVFKAMDQAVLLSNPDRVIKPGDGDYDPPSPGLPDSHCYNTWYNGHALDLGKFHKGYWQYIKPGWLYGCGEFGAEGLDPLNTMKKYYPESWLPANATDDAKWTANRISKSQTNTFHYMWYPTQTGLQNWIDASQDYQAWAMRFVTEAFRRDSRNVSSAVHLFIDAWPAGWMKAIMDVDRQPKKAFFAYRDALAPLMVSLRTDRYSLFAGEDAMVEAWVCNDKNEMPSGYRLGYEVVVDGKTIARDLVDADVPENAARFQGMINFKVPAVAARTKAILKAGLFNKEGICMNATIQELTLYPSYKPVQIRIFTDGKQVDKAAVLANEMRGTIVTSLEDAQMLIIGDASAYASNRNNIDQFVRKGGKVLFTEIPAGKYDIANTTVEVKHTIMGEYYFANPDATLLRDKQFQPKDFFLWYDKKAGYIQPLLRNVFRAEGWTPLVTTGLCNFAGEDPAGYLAAATLPLGKGKFIFCELTLANRVLENPAAFAFLKKVIQ
jgi:hypothetical protein